MQRLDTTAPLRLVLGWRALIFIASLVLAFLFAGLMEQPSDAKYAYVVADVMLSILAVLGMQRAGSRAVVAHFALAAAWNLGAFFVASLIA
jgi:hypothetical protein